MPCFLLINSFITLFFIIVYYEVVIVLVTGEPGPVNSSVAAEYWRSTKSKSCCLSTCTPPKLVPLAVDILLGFVVQLVPFHNSVDPVTTGPCIVHQKLKLKFVYLLLLNYFLQYLNYH
jgi:hypothetical protein